VSARCPLCDRLAPIRVVRVEGFRYVYGFHAHDNDGAVCFGRELR